MNPLQLITLALKLIGILGVGQTALFEDTNDAFVMLNAMISTWNRKRWLIYALNDFALTADGSLSYSIGPSGRFNVARPDKIEGAYIRRLAPQSGPSTNTIDYPLMSIDSHEDYINISLKSLQSFPSAIFYDSAYPLGNIYVWPIPDSSYEIHILVKETLKQFADLTTNINLPPEYQEALIWNLAARLRPLYQLPPDPTIVAMAKGALSTIRGANAQIPTMSLPAGLSRNSGGSYQNHGVSGNTEGTFTLNETVLG